MNTFGFKYFFSFFLDPLVHKQLEKGLLKLKKDVRQYHKKTLNHANLEILKQEIFKYHTLVRCSYAHHNNWLSYDKYNRSLSILENIHKIICEKKESDLVDLDLLRNLPRWKK